MSVVSEIHIITHIVIHIVIHTAIHIAIHMQQYGVSCLIHIALYS